MAPLHLLVEVMAAASAAAGIPALASACLQKICDLRQWHCGQAWFPSPGGDTLVCMPNAFYSTSDVTPFREASLNTRLLRGLGLPGCVWREGSAIWWAHAAQESNFVRKTPALETGLKSAFAFPVKLNGRVLAVFEFFSKETRQPDAPLLAIVEKLGDQLGEALERKRAEEALQENENRLRTLFDQVPATIWTTDRDLRLTSSRGAISRLPDYADVIGMKVRDLSPDGEVIEAAHLQALQGSPASYEAAVRGRAFQCHVEPLVDRGGNTAGVIGVALDISEIKKAEQALHDTETRWQLLCEKSGMAILTVDVASRVLSANPAAQQLFGYTEDELKQVTTLQLTHEDDLEKTRWIVREMIAGRKNVHRYEKRYRRKDGHLVWVSTTGTLVRDALGEPWFFTLMLEDISERKRAEAALSRLSERLRSLQDEERKRLSRELHDSTAQSLAALSLNLGVVEASADQLGAPAQRALRDAIALATQSAREIRTFAYLLHPPELEELGLGSALTAYVDGFAQRSGIRVDLDMPPKLPALSRELELHVFRIVQDSLANIQRHAASKTVRIRVVPRGEDLVLEVNHRSLLPAAEVRSKTSPIAVSIAGMRERARQVGGSLEMLSRKTGTTMRVTLPLSAAKGGERA